MIVSCPSCSTKYNLPDDKVRVGAKVRCTICKEVFSLVSSDGENAIGQVQEKQEAAPASIPDNTPEQNTAAPAPKEPAAAPVASAPAASKGEALDDPLAGLFDEAPAAPKAKDLKDDDLDDLFGEAAPKNSAAPAASKGEALDDPLAGLFDEAPAAPKAKDLKDDDLDDLFGEAAPKNSAAPAASKGEALDDPLAGLFDEAPAAKAKNLKDDDLDDLFGEAAPKSSAAPAASKGEALDDPLAGLFDEAPAAPKAKDLKDDDLDDLFGEAAPKNSAAPAASKGEALDDPLAGLFDEAPAAPKAKDLKDDDLDDLFGSADSQKPKAEQAPVKKEDSLDNALDDLFGDSDADALNSDSLDDLFDEKPKQNFAKDNAKDDLFSQLEEEAKDELNASSSANIPEQSSADSTLPPEASPKEAEPNLFAQKSSFDEVIQIAQAEDKERYIAPERDTLPPLPAKKTIPWSKIGIAGMLVVAVSVAGLFFWNRQQKREAFEAKQFAQKEKLKGFSVEIDNNFTIANDKIQSLQGNAFNKSIQQPGLGQIYVVTGTVTNNFTTPKAAIKIAISLLDEQGRVLSTKQQRCGVTATQFQLSVMDEKDLELYLNNEMAILANNSLVLPGQKVPFTVVFYRLFNKASSIQVNVVDASDVNF